MKHEIKRVSVIGTGKVGSHLARALARSGYRIGLLVNRTRAKAEKLAAELSAESSDDVRAVPSSTDLLIIAVPDREIVPIAREVAAAGRFGGILAHVSGTLPLNAVTEFYPASGVLYPLQSFTLEGHVDIRRVPFCIEGNTEAIATVLREVASRLSDDVRLLDSRQREIVHLAAVIGSNFTNYLYGISAGLLEKNGIDFSILHPLLLETAQRLASGHPDALQTGPAVRGDTATMDRHLELLSDMPEIKDLYRQLSRLIQEKFLTYHGKL